MKQPAGHARVRRSVPRKQVQLNLRRNSAPPEDELDDKPSNFWKWFALVFFIHVVGFIILMLAFRTHNTPPPTQFISLLPTGDIAKGTPGAQAAPKLGPTTPAPSHSAAPATPAPVTPPTPQPAKPKVHHVHPDAVKPPPILKDDAPPVAPTPKPKPPKPKIKVDLSHLVDAPATDEPVPPKAKPKPHAKKAVRPPDNTPEKDQADDSQTAGLSKQQVAQKLGAKLKAEGVDQGVTSGPSGAANSKANEFADFYASLRDQVMNKWAIPNLSDETATDPIVRIHVERDGRVPPESVTLERSSNNQVYDDSALAAARSIGYTLQPLPDGCPPDISITFKPNR
jgi:outer membrane biosynthesis protein TonB